MIRHLYEMANLRKDETGMNIVIYASSNRNIKHAPRIKVSKIYGNRTSESFFTITIEEEPRIIGNDTGNIKNRDINKIIEWVKLNKKLLLKYWFENISTSELINNLIKVKF